MNKLKTFWRNLLHFFYKFRYRKSDNYNKEVLKDINFKEITMETGVHNPKDLFQDTDFAAIDAKIKSKTIGIGWPTSRL